MRLAIVAAGDSPHTQPWVDAFAAAGHEVLVYAYPPVTHSFAGARVAEVPPTGPIGRARWLLRQLVQDRPDVASLHYVSIDSFALAVLGRVPLVLSAWGSDILLELRASRLKRALVGSALRRAALVVSPAKHLTRRLEDLGVAVSRVLTAQYGVDTGAFRLTDAVVSKPPVTVLCTRAFSSVYGIEDIIRAAALVPVDLVRALVFAGSGPLLPEMRDLAAALGVGDWCTFLGEVEHTGLPTLLRESDVYCSMSRSDGTSLSLLEAMACGLTPVVSDIEANREWIDDRVDGRLVAPGDVEGLAVALTQVAIDVDFRRRARDSVRAKAVERGDLTTNMTRIVEAVEGVVAHA